MFDSKSAVTAWQLSFVICQHIARHHLLQMRDLDSQSVFLNGGERIADMDASFLHDYEVLVKSFWCGVLVVFLCAALLVLQKKATTKSAWPWRVWLGRWGLK